MIFKREEFIKENPGHEKFPVMQIEQLSAVDGDEKRFIGRVSLGVQTPMGTSTLPISFEIAASTVQEAFEQFEAKAESEIENAQKELQDQLQEVRRKAQNRIVTPGELPGQMPGGQGGPDLGNLKL